MENTTQQTKKFIKDSFINYKPGDFIVDRLEAHEWKQEDLADIIGMSIKHVNEMINNKRPLTLETCILLGKAFKTSPDYWFNIDLRHKLTNLEDSVKHNQQMVIERAEIYQRMPITEMKKKCWIKKTEDIAELKDEVKKFWGMKEFDLNEIDAFPLPNCRRSLAFEENFKPIALKTWYRKALNCSSEIKAPKFKRKELEPLCDNILFYTENESRIKEFISELLKVGVKFIKLSHLQKTYLDGAAFIDESDNPVIAYTARHNRLDNFWWVIAHELGHIMNHLNNENRVIMDSDLYSKAISTAQTSEIEKEADLFAGEILHKKKIIDYFETLGSYITEERVSNYAKENEIHPSIVVGVLAFNGFTSYAMKTRFNETIDDKIPNEYQFN